MEPEINLSSYIILFIQLMTMNQFDVQQLLNAEVNQFMYSRLICLRFIHAS